MEILLAIALGFGGGWFFHQPSPIDCTNSALVITSCPEPTPITDASFGGHINKLQEIGASYRECRAACLVK
jgi:hypothetical protein